MGNGAIVPLLSTDPDDEAALDQEDANIDTIRTFYKRVYGDQDLGALDKLVTSGITIHRDGLVQRGRGALRNQILKTGFDHLDLHVDVQELVGAKNRVGYRLNVRYTDVNTGDPMRIRGISISRLTYGRIAETWVSYGDPEPNPE